MNAITRVTTAAIIAACVTAGHAQQAQQAQQDDKQAFRFRTGVELINVTATVTDGTGRFVSGLRKEDFRVYEDDGFEPSDVKRGEFVGDARRAGSGEIKSERRNVISDE